MLKWLTISVQRPQRQTVTVLPDDDPWNFITSIDATRETPSTFTVEIRDPDEPYRLWVTVQVRSEIPRVARLVLEAWDNDPADEVTTNGLLRVGVVRAARLAIDAAATERSPEDEEDIVFRPSIKGIKLSEVHLVRVADVYRDARARRLPGPVNEVAKYFDVKRATAASWVEKARRQGFLEPDTTKRGHPRTDNPAPDATSRKSTTRKRAESS
jgi:hypothetical protein